jgi:hypothetical protein
MNSALAAGSLIIIAVGGGLVAFVILVVIIRFVLGVNRSLQQRDDIINLLKEIKARLPEPPKQS